MKELKQELKKEFTRKDKPLLIEAVFKALENNSGCMLEVDNIFTYFQYMKKDDYNSYLEKYNAYLVITGQSVSISISYNNLSLISFHTLQSNKSIKQFADLYNDKENDVLYFISGINEVELSGNSVIIDIEILTASSSLVDSVIIK